jgi:hypothetical protein
VNAPHAQHLTTQQVLDLLRQRGRAITAATWRSYVARGQAPAPATHVGRTPLWSIDDIDRWLPDAHPTAHQENEMSALQHAEKIRSTVQAELGETSVAALAAIPEIHATGGLTRYVSGAAAHHLAAGQRGYELLPVAELAAEIGDGFELDINPIGDELAADVVEVTQRHVQAARAAIAAFTWPAATGDHMEAARAAQAVARHAGLLRFVELFG